MRTVTKTKLTLRSMFPNALRPNWCHNKLCYEQAVVQVSMIGLGSLLTVFLLISYHSL